MADHDRSVEEHDRASREAILGTRGKATAPSQSEPRPVDKYHQVSKEAILGTREQAKIQLSTEARTAREAYLGTDGGLSNLRVHEASRAYQEHGKKPENRQLTAGEYYQRQLGKAAHGKEKEFASDSLQNHAAKDLAIGKQMILSGKYTEKDVAHALAQHSPAAGRYPEKARTTYCEGIAKAADRKAQESRQVPQRSAQYDRANAMSKQAILATRPSQQQQAATMNQRHERDR